MPIFDEHAEPEKFKCKCGNETFFPLREVEVAAFYVQEYKVDGLNVGRFRPL